MIAQTTNELKNGLGAEKRPNAEVKPRAQPRSFSAAYKQKILAQADAATGSGAIGAFLRREELYTSHLTHWRQEKECRNQTKG